jgi:hypothetical protein
MEIIEKSLEVDIQQVENWKNNARSIQKADFERLKEQIKNLGVYKPLVCYQDNDKYIVLGGNMRLRALRELKQLYKQPLKVWITVIKPKDEQEKLQINLSDNDRAGYYDETFYETIFPFKNSEIWKDYKIDFSEPFDTVEKVIKDQFEDNDNKNEDDGNNEPKEKQNECPSCGYKL